MDTGHLLEKAKELLIKDKNLTPVLFIETKKGIYVVGLVVDLQKIDKREIMMDIGSKVAQKGEELVSVSFISDSYVTKVDIEDKKNLEKGEAIVILKLSIANKKREVITQEYERLDEKIIFKGVSEKSDHSEIFLLDAFVQGYDRYRKRNIAKYN